MTPNGPRDMQCADGDIVVAFDTATDVLAIGIGRWCEGHLEVLSSVGESAPRKANTVLLPRLRDDLGRLGLAPSRISAVVTGRGPGSFTGVRIGVATAKGLAHGLGIPLYGVGTLDALACRFLGEDALLGLVGDAMRGEVYPALFEVAGDRVSRLTEDTVERPEVTAQRWAEQVERPLVLAGNGLAKHADAFQILVARGATLAPPQYWTLDGAALLAAFERAVGSGRAGGGDPGALLPVYTRLSDAEESERQRAGSSSCDVPASGVGGGAGQAPSGSRAGEASS